MLTIWHRGKRIKGLNTLGSEGIRHRCGYKHKAGTRRLNWAERGQNFIDRWQVRKEKRRH